MKNITRLRLYRSLAFALDQTFHPRSKHALVKLIAGEFRYSPEELDVALRRMASMKPIMVLVYCESDMDEFRHFLHEKKLKPVIFSLGYWLRLRFLRRHYLEPMEHFHFLLKRTIVPCLCGSMNLLLPDEKRKEIALTLKTARQLKEAMDIKSTGRFGKRRAINRMIWLIQKLRRENRLGFLDHFFDLEALISLCEVGINKQFRFSKFGNKVEFSSLYNPMLPVSKSMDFRALSAVSWATFPRGENYPFALEAILSCVYLANKGLSIPAFRGTVPRVEEIFWHINLMPKDSVPEKTRLEFEETVCQIRETLVSGKTCFALLYEPALLSPNRVSSHIIELMELFKKSAGSMLILATDEVLTSSQCPEEVNQIEFVDLGTTRPHEAIYLSQLKLPVTSVF
jgi:hypothetical protein